MIPTLAEFKRVHNIDNYKTSAVLSDWGFSEKEQENICFAIYKTRDIDEYKASVTIQYMIRHGLIKG